MVISAGAVSADKPVTQKAYRLNPYSSYEIEPWDPQFRYWKIAVNNQSADAMKISLMKDCPRAGASHGTQVGETLIIPRLFFSGILLRQAFRAR